MENRVFVYTKFGYASVDLERYKEELSQSVPSNHSSPERLLKAQVDAARSQNENNENNGA